MVRQHEFYLNYDEDILKQIKLIKNNQDKAVEKALLEEPDWKEHNNGLITWQDRIYIPKDAKLRERIILLNHDSLIAGYSAQYKT